MSLEGAALRLTVFVGEVDTWHHRPLFTEIVHQAHRAGLVIVNAVEVIRYIGRKHQARP